MRWWVPVSNFLNRGKTERVEEKRKGERKKPGRKAKPKDEVVSEVTVESRRRERDIKNKYRQGLREHDSLQRRGEEGKSEVKRWSSYRSSLVSTLQEGDRTNVRKK